MRVLFTSTPEAGHFQPLVPLAQALSAGGHDVAVASSESLRTQIEAAGFRAFSAGRWIGEQPEAARAVLRGSSRSAREASIDVYLNVMVTSNTRRAVADLVEICRAWRPDVVVREEAEFGGAVAAEYLGLPHAAVQVLFFQRHAALDRAVSKKLDRIRDEWQLPPDPRLDMLYRYLFISFTPPCFLRPHETAPPTMHFLRRVDSRPRLRELSLRWLSDELPRPVIYATLGTTMDRAHALFPGMFPDVFPTLIDGLREIAGTLIVTVGPRQDPALYDLHLPHIHVERYVPNDIVFPRCDVVVTHGGHNTVIPALLRGLPLVLIPFWADQPDNAERCAEIGVGRVIDPTHLTADRLRSVTQEVLQDPGYRLRAHAVREEMLALPPVEHAAALLEHLVRTRAPVIAQGDTTDADRVPSE